MQGRRTTESYRGLTPVVGIVLLVAITLLLASSVAAFAFGLEDDSSTDSVPTVALRMEYDEQPAADDTLRIVHQSGQTVDTSKLAVVIDGAACTGGSTPDGRYRADPDLGMSGGLTAGESIRLDGSTLCPSNDLDLSSATVRVVWVPESGTSTQLRTWTGPG